jgi:hypothetical protein
MINIIKGFIMSDLEIIVLSLSIAIFAICLPDLIGRFNR